MQAAAHHKYKQTNKWGQWWCRGVYMHWRFPKKYCDLNCQMMDDINSGRIMHSPQRKSRTTRQKWKKFKKKKKKSETKTTASASILKQEPNTKTVKKNFNLIGQYKSCASYCHIKFAFFNFFLTTYVSQERSNHSVFRRTYKGLENISNN